MKLQVLHSMMDVKEFKDCFKGLQFFDKTFNGSGAKRTGTPVKISVKPNQKLPDERHQPIIKKIKKRDV